MGRQKLPLFNVHRQATLSNRPDEVGLAAEKCRGLQHIHHGSNLGHLFFGMDIGEHRKTELVFHGLQNLQARIAA
nr:hypothetical protein NCPCFENI_01144 [Cupriavidus sp.]